MSAHDRGSANIWAGVNDIVRILLGGVRNRRGLFVGCQRNNPR
jgi:hypothetical protein